MSTDLNRDALEYHELPRPGKLSVELTKPTATARDLSLAYSPGVAEPVRRIAEHPADAYRYTNKGNLVAVVSNGTAILGRERGDSRRQYTRRVTEDPPGTVGRVSPVPRLDHDADGRWGRPGPAGVRERARPSAAAELPRRVVRRRGPPLAGGRARVPTGDPARSNATPPPPSRSAPARTSRRSRTCSGTRPRR